MVDVRGVLLGREEEIIRLLNILLEHNLDFIVVGGYAIATYKKRFSVDLDIIIRSEDFEKFEKLLGKEGYSFSYSKNIALLYGEEFKRFIKKVRGLDVCVDLLINGLVSRMTDAVWSFDYVKKYSGKRDLDNLEFLIPERELLIAMKLNSGRLADVRDVVVLMPCNFEKLKKHVFKGDTRRLMESIKKQKEFLEKPQFDDGFKGIFGPLAYKQVDVEKARELLFKLLKD